MSVPFISVSPGWSVLDCVEGLVLVGKRNVDPRRWPIRPADTRMVGSVPSVVLAGVLHIGVFLLAYGARPVAAPHEVAPPTLTLVSLPPEPPDEPSAPADQRPAEDMVSAVPQPMAAAQDAEALPEPAPPVSSTPPELETPPAPTPPAQDPAPLAATAEMLPEPALPAPSLPSELEAKDAMVSPQPVATQAVHKPAVKAAPPRMAPAKPMRQASHSVRADPRIDAPHPAEASAGEAQPMANTPKPLPMPAPRAAPAAVEASFGGRLLQAVQAEARRSYPPSARFMGTTGQAVVAFEYRDGTVHVTGLAQTSGSPVLDRAALAAVQNASYPPPPSELAGQTLARQVHVKFELTPG